VSSVLAEVTPFFEKGQRAELFEMIDNKMPTIKITIPEQEYDSLLEVINPVQQDFYNYFDEEISETATDSVYNEEYIITDNDFKTKNATLIFELDG